MTIYINYLSLKFLSISPITANTLRRYTVLLSYFPTTSNNSLPPLTLFPSLHAPQPLPRTPIPT